MEGNTFLFHGFIRIVTRNYNKAIAIFSLRKNDRNTHRCNKAKCGLSENKLSAYIALAAHKSALDRFVMLRHVCVAIDVAKVDVSADVIAHASIILQLFAPDNLPRRTIQFWYLQ